MEDQLCRGQLHGAGLTSVGLWCLLTLPPADSAPWVCHLWGCLGGASTWSEIVHQVCGHWGLLGGAGQGLLPPVPCLGPAGLSYKAICRWLLLALGLKVPRRGQAMNWGQLPFVAGLGPLSKTYSIYWGQMLLVWQVLGKSPSWAKRGSLYWKATGNGWDGPASWWGWDSGNHQGRVNSVSQVDRNSDMVPACWLCRRRAEERNNGLCWHFCLGKSFHSSSCPDAR